MKPNKLEIEAVSKLQPFDRYKYFIKKVADSEKMFTLVDNFENYLISTLEKNKLFPLWSSEEFAFNCIVDGWANAKIKEISVNDFLNEISDFILNNNYIVNVFPLTYTTGFIVTNEEFIRDLKVELENYE